MTEVQEVNHSRIVVFTWYRRNVYIRKRVGFVRVWHVMAYRISLVYVGDVLIEYHMNMLWCQIIS